VHLLAERVLSYIRRDELLSAGERVGVAVSGGIDSVALLRVMLESRGELGIVVAVVHFNHRLRAAESDADQEFVAGLARAFDLEFYVDGDDVAGHAASEGVSVETAARELRYGFFRRLLKEDQSSIPLLAAKNAARNGAPDRFASSLNKIVTGHTLDDQAETVLMRMIRGAGLRGLGGIHPRIVVEDEDGEFSGEIVRPLLTVRRRELEQYLTDIGQGWREDSTNSDEQFTRNRVRRLVVPLLEREFNPAVAENLAELAEIARGEEDYWENEVSGWLGTVVQWSQPEWARAVSVEKSLVQIAGIGKSDGGAASFNRPTSRTKGAREKGRPSGDELRAKIDGAPWLVMNASVSRMWFLGEPVAVQRRLVKAIGENAGIPLEFKHVEEVLRVAAEDSAARKELSLPLGWRLVLEPEELVFVTPDLRDPVPLLDYEYELAVPGKVIVYEAGASIEARAIPAGVVAGYNPEHLLDAVSLPGRLRVRNWRAGDRFWPAHTKSPKKIKELLQERHVAQPERRFWPVIVSSLRSSDENGEEIVWMRGFPVPARLRAQPGQAAILIVDQPLGSRAE
jgi:tRNA(Ile)-lysidine synthase